MTRKLPKTSRTACAARDFLFVHLRARALTAFKQKSRPDCCLVGFVTPSGLLIDVDFQLFMKSVDHFVDLEPKNWAILAVFYIGESVFTKVIERRDLSGYSILSRRIKQLAVNLAFCLEKQDNDFNKIFPAYLEGCLQTTQ